MEQVNIRILTFYNQAGSTPQMNSSRLEANSGYCCEDKGSFENAFNVAMFSHSSSTVNDDLTRGMRDLLDSVNDLLKSVESTVNRVNSHFANSTLTGTLTIGQNGQFEITGTPHHHKALVFNLVNDDSFGAVCDRLRHQYILLKFANHTREMAEIFGQNPRRFTHSVNSFMRNNNVRIRITIINSKMSVDQESAGAVHKLAEKFSNSQRKTEVDQGECDKEITNPLERSLSENPHELPPARPEPSTKDYTFRPDIEGVKASHWQKAGV